MVTKLKLFLLSLVVAACAPNPVKSALAAPPEHRPEIVAFALHNSYVIVAERAVSVAENEDTPRGVRSALIRLHDAASPVVKNLREAALEYKKVKEELDSGQGTFEKVQAALGELNRLLPLAAAKMDSLALTIGGGE